MAPAVTEGRSGIEWSSPVRDRVYGIVLLAIFLVPLVLFHLSNSNNAAERTPVESGGSPASAESDDESPRGSEEDRDRQLEEAELRADNAEREAAEAQAAREDAEAAQEEAEALAEELEDRHRQAEEDSLLCQGGYYNPDC